MGYSSFSKSCMRLTAQRAWECIVNCPLAVKNTTGITLSWITESGFVAPRTFLRSVIFVLCAQALITQAGADTSVYTACGGSAKARELARLVMTDPGQKRERLTCNALLASIADKKAREMAELERVTHFGSEFANKRLVKAGYRLSPIYPRLFENNVEAILGGIAEPDDVWKAFKESTAHRTHLMAEHEFYRLQDEIGVGYYRKPSSPHVDYWVIYVAHRKERQPYRGTIARSKN